MDIYNFPPIENARADGLLAIGGDVHPNHLLIAYKKGIFPWYNEGEPIYWYSPKKRMVLYPEKLRISKSMRNLLRKEIFTITFNQNFPEVIRLCKTVKRKHQEEGTWITDALEESMIELHKRGIAQSVEVWKEDRLVGGLYGLDIGTMFCGESMFHLVSNASKVAFIALTKQIQNKGYPIIDCQVYNEHLASLGAEEIPQSVFKKYLPLK
jgi:leucyl/phenylalanyl-tRNA--protein transferase